MEGLYVEPGEARRREEAIAWFAALRAGAMLAEDRAAYDAWRADPLNQAALDRIHQLWGELAVLKDVNAIARPSRPAWRRPAALAAAVVVLAAAGLGVLLWRDDRVIETAIGQQKVQALPDGSMVAVNVDSRLSYDIAGVQRIVNVRDGEAAFSVQAGPAKPFIVRAGDYEVRAHGTEFNIRSRDDAIEVSVGEGVVQICPILGAHADEAILTLKAGEIVRLPAKWPGDAFDPPSPKPVAAADVSGWRDYVVSYEDAAVQAIVDDLNRYFERKLLVEDKPVSTMRVTVRLQVRDRESAIGTLARLLGLCVEQRPEVDVLAR